MIVFYLIKYSFNYDFFIKYLFKSSFLYKKKSNLLNIEFMNLFDFLHSLSSYKRSGVTKRLTLSVKAIIKNCHKINICVIFQIQMFQWNNDDEKTTKLEHCKSTLIKTNTCIWKCIHNNVSTFELTY